MERAGNCPPSLLYLNWPLTLVATTSGFCPARRPLGSAHRTAARGLATHRLPLGGLGNARSTRPRRHPSGRAGRSYPTSSTGRAYTHAYARSAPAQTVSRTTETPGCIAGTPPPAAGRIAVPERNAGTSAAAAGIAGAIADGRVAGRSEPDAEAIAAIARSVPVRVTRPRKASRGCAYANADISPADPGFPQPHACTRAEALPRTEPGLRPQSFL
jgi:hypothetical protein